MRVKADRNKEKGTALLVVLFIVMTITVLSLGFLSRSDVELACGRNMVLRTQMDYLAESGLEHAKGLILNPQDVNSEYWQGALRQQLVAGSDDYYDVNVVKLGESNYQITCDAYREKNGERIGRSSLQAELRLDPCFAIRTGNQWTTEAQTTINGDVYCGSSLLGVGDIRGDAFARGNITVGNVLGRRNENVSTAPIDLPGLSVSDFSSSYYIETVEYDSTPIFDINVSETFNPDGSNPAGILYYNGDVNLPGGVNITGMLVVNGTLRINGSGNTITAVKNFPALIVRDRLIFEDGGRLEVNGLAQIGREIEISSGAEDVRLSVVGSLFIVSENIDGLEESPSGSSFEITAAPDKAAIEIWPTPPGNALRWTPAAGAFFRSIEKISG